MPCVSSRWRSGPRPPRGPWGGGSDRCGADRARVGVGRAHREHDRDRPGSDRRGRRPRRARRQLAPGAGADAWRRSGARRSARGRVRARTPGRRRLAAHAPHRSEARATSATTSWWSSGAWSARRCGSSSWTPGTGSSPPRPSTEATSRSRSSASASCSATPSGSTRPGSILVHNHPSGDPTPSPDDLHLTAEAVAAGRLLDIARARPPRHRSRHMDQPARPRHVLRSRSSTRAVIATGRAEAPDVEAKHGRSGALGRALTGPCVY